MTRFGSVVAFDGPSGLGEIAVADGTTIPFHCVSIADGSRTIEVGAAVRFEELRKLGRLEAARIEPT